MTRVFVTGGTGFLGRRLVEMLIRRGDTVSVATRSLAKVQQLFGDRARAVQWDPRSTEGWGGTIAEHDAVVHLAGESAVGQRWTDSTKKAILSSRVDSTTALVEALRAATPRPSVFVCATAVGYYGHRDGSEVLDETAAPGDDFLSRVTQQWEAAAQRAEEFGVRVVRARFGIILGPGGGALSEMVKPFKMFLGGPIASGEQVVSWVHIDDAAGAVLYAIDNASVTGAINVTAPNPVTNEELSHAIGRVLSRPSSVRVPEIALRLRFGEGADPLVTGQRVMPRALSEAGYTWRFTEVEPALRDGLAS